MPSCSGKRPRRSISTKLLNTLVGVANEVKRDDGVKVTCTSKAAESSRVSKCRDTIRASARSSTT